MVGKEWMVERSRMNGDGKRYRGGRPGIWVVSKRVRVRGNSIIKQGNARNRVGRRAREKAKCVEPQKHVCNAQGVQGCRGCGVNMRKVRENMGMCYSEQKMRKSEWMMNARAGFVCRA